MGGGHEFIWIMDVDLLGFVAMGFYRFGDMRSHGFGAMVSHGFRDMVSTGFGAMGSHAFGVFLWAWGYQFARVGDLVC